MFMMYGLHRIYEVRECTSAEAARLLQSPRWIGLYGVTVGKEHVIICGRIKRK